MTAESTYFPFLGEMLLFTDVHYKRYVFTVFWEHKRENKQNFKKWDPPPQ